MNILGINPDRDDGRAVDYRIYPFFKILYSESEDGGKVSMARAVFVIITLAIMASGCLWSVTQSQTAEQMLDNLKGMHLEVMVLMVAINECVSRPRMRRIMAYIDKSRANPRYGFPEEETIMLEASKKARADMTFLVIIFAANFPLMMVTKPVTESVGGHSWKQLPFPWTILPDDDDMIYVAILLFHTLGVGFSHCLGIVGMCFSTITTQITALFDVLLLGIERIEERAARKMKQLGLSYEESMLRCIEESVAHHQELIREVRSEKPHLESQFFAEIVNISMIMACEAFPLIRPNLTVLIAIKGLVFLVVQVICTAVLCDRLEIMADQNTEVFNALYNSPWYKCGVDYGRIVSIGMTFSQHSLTIRGKSFLGLIATRATFYTAMVNTFNLLSMIRKMS
uniref:Odorant receptor n=1 Tax=Adelphocoris lineolatus TaxID=236346 RepID=A0A2I4PH52_ADELI|nr:olfactory receptor 37 [Adelphocoris lineolatus]